MKEWESMNEKINSISKNYIINKESKDIMMHRWICLGNALTVWCLIDGSLKFKHVDWTQDESSSSSNTKALYMFWSWTKSWANWLKRCVLYISNISIFSLVYYPLRVSSLLHLQGELVCVQAQGNGTTTTSVSEVYMVFLRPFHCGLLSKENHSGL